MRAAFPDGGPTEADVVVFYDPVEDLGRRASRWKWDPVDPTLAGLCGFAGGLALVEYEARVAGEAEIALEAYLQRRHLIADRLLHWGVPVLAEAESQSPEPDGALGALLELGESLRPAPVGGGGEGLSLPGHDSYGGLEPAPDAWPDPWLRSIWSGWWFAGSAGSSASPIPGGCRILGRDDATPARFGAPVVRPCLSRRGNRPAAGGAEPLRQGRVVPMRWVCARA